MAARQNLVDAYTAWEQLTRSESQAIHDGNWLRVSECQKAKQELQERIIRLTDATHAECAEAGLDREDFERNLRPIINGLIELETHNAGLVADRRRAAKSQVAELDHAGRSLKRVQKSYVPPPQPMWHSYS